MIFNNSRANGVSQLGGMVLLNPNLQRTATAILTEVTGNRPSSINGTLEVYGDKADLLISNPNGLSLNGVTALNTASLTVSTGRVRDAAGGLQFLVDDSSGQVLIGADGVNTAGLSYFDLVARSVALQGAVGSQAQQTDVQIAAGQGTYDPSTRSFTAKPGAQGSGLAISGSAAGAMHGRFIHLISSDSGAGVRHEGLILAARDIRISAAGDIELHDTGANGQAQITSTGSLINRHTLQAGSALTIIAKDLVNRSGAYVGTSNDLTIAVLNSLLNEQGATLLTEGNLHLQAGNSLSNAGGIQAVNGLAISTKNLSNSGTGLIRGKTLTVSAQQLDNVDGATFYGSDTARFSVSGELRNQNGAGIYAQKTLSVQVLGSMLNQAATLAADTISLNAASLTNGAAAKLLADAGLSIELSGELLNDGATLAAKALSVKATSLTNKAAGTLLADTALTLDVSGAVRNNAATLAAGKTLTIVAGTDLSNDVGGLITAETVEAQARGFYNRGASQIQGTDINLTASGVFSSATQASIQASHNLAVEADSFSASASELLAGNDLSLSLGSYQNSALISSKNTATLSLKNAADLRIDGQNKTPQAANLLAFKAHHITVTGELNNPGSVLIQASGDVRNQGAVIVGKTLGIEAAGLIENGPGKLIWAGENLFLKAGTQLLNGLDSQLLAQGDISLSAGEKVQNNVGRIEAQNNLWIDTPLLENLSQASGAVVRSGEVNEDVWYSEKDGLIERDYWNTQITLPLYSSTVTVKQGVIRAGADMGLNQSSGKNTGATVRNSGGLMAAGGNLLMDGTLENLGLAVSKRLAVRLREAHTVTQRTNSSILVEAGDSVSLSLYDMLGNLFRPDGWSSEWLDSLRLVVTPEASQLLSAVLGADWKALSQDQLRPRWAAFKTSDKTQNYYAATQAEMSAGQTFVHTGGTFTNGDGATWHAQRPISVKVGSESVDTLDGELDAQFSLSRDNAQKILDQQLHNPLFQRRQPAAEGDVFSRIKPLYETRVQYLDQTQFLGAQYFLDKIGYDPNKSVNVLGDAYFDHQLIVRSVEQRVGNFFAQTQRLSGAALVKTLMDNGAALAASARFTLGQALTAEQIDGLKDDVVWYENRVVDGQTVLAPRLYLSQKTLAARGEDANSAALVSADTVLIDALGVNNINGTVRAKTDAFVYSKSDINNISQGGAQAGFFAGVGGVGKTAGQLVIAAEGQVRNQGGVMSGYQQTLVGGNGISSSATTGYDKQGYLVVRDNGLLGTALSADKPEDEKKDPGAAQPPAEKSPLHVAKPDVRARFEERLAAGPVDTSQGSSLSLISGGDIDLVGAITQADNVLLQTTGSVNLKDLHEARSAFDAVGSTGVLSQVDITEMAASANSVGNTLNSKNLVIQAQQDLNITGGEMNADTSALDVGGNSTVAAGKDLAFHEKTVSTTQLVAGAGAGAGGYEANGKWGSAAAVDTHLASPFTGQGEGTVVSPTLRGQASAGRSAASQTLASNATGATTGANKGRGATSGANYKVGIETVTTTDSSESTTYRNAQLNLGSGSVTVGGSFDMGGADINAGYQISPEQRAKMSTEERRAATDALPTLAISAGDIKTSKYENTEKTTHRREELFVGYTGEAHSSLADVATQVSNTAHKAMGKDVVNDANAPAGSSKTLATQEQAMEIDPALTAVAVAGQATQVAFGEVAGASATIGMQHSEESRDSQSRAQNINQLGGNISLTSTHGDIELNGVNLQGGKVAIKSAGNLSQRAAKSSSSSRESVTTHTVGLTVSAGVSPTGAGAGASVGASGSYDNTHSSATSYTNGLISGSEVSIETAGDHTLMGSNIKGNSVSAKIGGNQIITSVQDSSDMTHTRGNWSTSVGVAFSTAGGIIPTASASGSGGKDVDNSKLTAEQAGIDADNLNLNVGGNLNLTGAHIVSQQGSVKVDGKISATTLHDSREKDGGYGGGGGGISKNGIPTGTVEFGRVDQVHYQADNYATLAVGNPGNVTAGQGISGPLTTDANTQLVVTENRRVAGTDVKIEISISDAQEIKAGVKKLFTPKAGGAKYHLAEAPSSHPQANEISKTAPSVETPKTTPSDYADVEVDAPKSKQVYERHIIVNTDSSNPTVTRAAENLANKHADKSVIIALNPDGSHTEVQGTMAPDGKAKVQFVGHADGLRLGAFDAKQLVDVLAHLPAAEQIGTVNLVGCGTACANNDGLSLVDAVRAKWPAGDNSTVFRGYKPSIEVDPNGHKQEVLAGAAQALGKGDPKPQHSEAGPSREHVAQQGQFAEDSTSDVQHTDSPPPPTPNYGQAPDWDMSLTSPQSSEQSFDSRPPATPGKWLESQSVNISERSVTSSPPPTPRPRVRDVDFDMSLPGSPTASELSSLWSRPRTPGGDGGSTLTLPIAEPGAAPSWLRRVEEWRLPSLNAPAQLPTEQASWLMPPPAPRQPMEAVSQMKASAQNIDPRSETMPVKRRLADVDDGPGTSKKPAIRSTEELSGQKGTPMDEGMPTLEQLLSGQYGAAANPISPTRSSTGDIYIDALSEADLLMGFEHLSAPPTTPITDAQNVQLPHEEPPSHPSPHDRPITREDMQNWDDMPYSEQQKVGGATAWLQANGISLKDRVYLTNTGISQKGRKHMGKLSIDAAAPRTHLTSGRLRVNKKLQLLKSYDFDALTDADNLRGVELLTDARSAQVPSADSAQIRVPVAGSSTQTGRRMSVEDMHRWHSLTHQEQVAAGGIKGWLAENNIQYMDRRLLTTTGISAEGYNYINRNTAGVVVTPFTVEQIQRWSDFSQEERDSYGGWMEYGKSLGIVVNTASVVLTNKGLTELGRVKLAQGQGSSITYEQVKQWYDMPQYQKDASGGWQGYAAQHGIALGSAVNMLTNKGLRVGGLVKLSAGQGRRLSLDDIAAWNALLPGERSSAGGWKGWASSQGISLASAMLLISNKGLTPKGEFKLAMAGLRRPMLISQTLPAQPESFLPDFSQIDPLATPPGSPGGQQESLHVERLLPTVEGNAQGLQHSDGMPSPEKKFEVPAFLDVDPTLAARLVVKPSEQQQPPGSNSPLATIEERADAAPRVGRMPSPEKNFGVPTFLNVDPTAAEHLVVNPSEQQQPPGSNPPLATIEERADAAPRVGRMPSPEKKFGVPAFLDIDPTLAAHLVVKPSEQQQPPGSNSPLATIEERADAAPPVGRRPSPEKIFALPSVLEIPPVAQAALVVNPPGASGSKTPEQLVEPQTKDKGVGTIPGVRDVFNLLSNLRSGSSYINLADEMLMDYAVENNMVDKEGRLTREGITMLNEMNNERKLLIALSEMRAQSAETSRMNNQKKNAFIYKLSSKTHVSQEVLRRYIFDPQKIDDAIEEIKIKWSDQ